MRIQEVRSKATALGLELGQMKKPDLIRAIQRREGYAACYGTFHAGCPYTDCCFRSDCRKEKPAPGS